MKSLYVQQLNEGKIVISEAVKTEMLRLRTEAKLQIKCMLPATTDGQLVVGFQNVRSLHKHFQGLKNHHLVQQFGVLGVAETKLWSSDISENYSIDEFRMHLKDYPRNKNTRVRPPYGLVAYHKTEAVLQAPYSKQQAEFLILFLPQFEI